jgi:hypothetical protein
VIFDGDLGLAVRPQKIQSPIFPYLGQAPGQFVGVHDGHRHQFRRFVRGEAEHEPLVAGTLIFEEAGTLVHALGDVRALMVDAGDDGTGAPIESHLRRVVADIFDGIPDDLGHIHIAFGGNLTGDKGQTGGDQGFTGNTAAFVLSHDGIEYRVGNGIGHFVRMALGD